MGGALITVGPVLASVSGPPEYASAVRAGLTVPDPAAEYKRWGGDVKFHRAAPDGGVAFPAGLTWRVLSIIRAAGLERPEVEWPSGVVFTPPLAGELRGMEWRPYQVEAVEKFMRAKRMVLQCPTSGGKTEIAIEAVRRVAGRALWVTHLKELMRQTPGRFRDRLGVECAVVEAGREIVDSPVTVGMVQTLSRVLRVNGPKWFEQFDVLVMDEAHHAGAETWQAVARACSRATWRLGLSGTVGDEIVRLPLVTQLRIEGALGPTFTAGTTMGLAGQGFVAAPRIVMLACPPTTYPSYEEVRQAVCPDWRDDPRRILGRAGTRLFAVAYRRGITENEARNRLVVETTVRHIRAGDKFLVLCNRVPHAVGLGVSIARRLEFFYTGNVWTLSGDADEGTRADVLRKFKTAPAGACLVCTPFFREGVDVPQVDAGFLAGGGESDVAVLQALGRMLRPRPDKPEVLVYDVLDGRDPRQPKDYLANHRKSRVALYLKSGFTVERG